PAQERFEVDPWREGPLAGPLGVAVHDAVENLQAVVAHPERVSVRKGQAQLAADLTMILDDPVQFTAGVLARHAYLRQQPRDRLLQIPIHHGNSFGATDCGAPSSAAIIMPNSRSITSISCAWLCSAINRKFDIN